MATLKSKAEAILAEKQSKITPENIKNGVAIFGIEGAYTGNKTIEDGFFLSGSDIENNSVNCPALVYCIKCYEYFDKDVSSYTTVYNATVKNNTDSTIDMTNYLSTLKFEFYDANNTLIFVGRCFQNATLRNKYLTITSGSRISLRGDAQDNLHNVNNWQTISKCVVSDMI